MVAVMSLCRLVDASRALREVNPDLARWLATAAERLRHGLPPALALELAGPGARRERDRYLCQAATALREDGETVWHLSGRLAARVGQTRHRDLVQELLVLATQAAPLPRSPRQIYSILLDRLTD